MPFILGAGVLGINSAYVALRQGKSVCVIDHRSAAGLETSFDFRQPRRALGHSVRPAQDSSLLK
jgi:glycine/D-amino acid oxidase-like deaminating enzyme